MMYALIAFAVAFGVTAAIGPAAIRLLRQLKVGQKILEDGPTWHKNKQNIPTMGGFIIMAGMAVALLTTVFFIGGKAYAFVATTCAMGFAFGAIGFLDDYSKVKKKQNKGLSAWQKLVLQIAAAILFISVLRYLGYVTPVIRLPFLNVSRELPWVVYNVFMAFVIVGTVNAVNLTDGLDGLAASVTMTVTVFFAFYAFKAASISPEAISATAAALAGALAGFLIFNSYPAKVFMGDTGSLFLGAMVCGFAFALDYPVLLVPIGIVYVVETLSDIIQIGYFKISGGKRVFKMAPLHHHFEMCGYSERKIVTAAVALTAISCALTYFFA